MTRYVALLRAVNVGGRKVTMKELREMAEGLGYENVRTLLASGNLTFETKKAPAAKLEATLEAAIEKTFGLFSDVMVRDPAEWRAIIAANPFPKKAKADPAHLVVAVGKSAPDAKALAAWLETFRAKYDKGEQLKAIGRDLFIDYGDSTGLSKLVIPKKLFTGTARNWNTVLKIAEALTE
jgi:uncharacterized protein (DUF1697 family)